MHFEESRILFSKLVQLASLADMGVSLPRDKETFVCCWYVFYISDMRWY